MSFREAYILKQRLVSVIYTYVPRSLTQRLHHTHTCGITPLPHNALQIHSLNRFALCFPPCLYFLQELSCRSFSFMSMSTVDQLVTGRTHGWELDAIMQPVSDFCKMTDILSELNGNSRVSCHTPLCVLFYL